MKEQYLAMITRGNGDKENAILRTTQRKKRYASTLLEAQQAIEICKNEYTLKDVGKTSTISCGCIGISSVLDEGTYESLKVVSSSIKVRMVSPWEDVE